MTAELVTSSLDGRTVSIVGLPEQDGRVAVAILHPQTGQELASITLAAPEGAHLAAGIMRVVLPVIQGRAAAGE